MLKENQPGEWRKTEGPRGLEGMAEGCPGDGTGKAGGTVMERQGEHP